jgi:hypothetical protein
MFENVRIRPEAELDLQDAYSYFEQCKFGLGNDFMECVENALAKVSTGSLSFSLGIDVSC